MSKSIKALKRISTMMGSKEGINKIMKDLEELEIEENEEIKTMGKGEDEPDGNK